MRSFFIVLVYAFLTGCSGVSNADQPDKPLFNLSVKEIFEDERVRSLAEPAARNDTKKIRALLDSGVAVNSHGVGSFTPLYWALKKDAKKGFEFLLKNGASCNTLWTDGGSVLHFAAAMDDSDFLSLCLSFGAEVELRDGVEGKSPIFYAVESNSRENVEMLLDNGANIDVLDNSQTTPLLFAAMLNQYQMVHHLLLAGADPTAKNQWGKGIGYLIEKSSRTMDRSSPLWVWREKVVEMLSN